MDPVGHSSSSYSYSSSSEDEAPGLSKTARKKPVSESDVTLKNAFANACKGAIVLAVGLYEFVLKNDPDNKEARCCLDLLKRRNGDPNCEMTLIHLSACVLANNPENQEARRRLDLTPSKKEELLDMAGKDDLDAHHTFGIMYLEIHDVKRQEPMAAAHLISSGERGRSKLEEMYLQCRCITADSYQHALTYLTQ